MENTCFLGESFPLLNPNLGPDIFAASYGCDLRFMQDTSYSVPFVDEWEKLPELRFDDQKYWWRKIEQMTREIVDDARGDYFVGITDLHPGADALVALRGPENLCLDLIENPEILLKRSFELLPGFKEQLDRLYQITSSNLAGSANWMEVWHPDKWYVTSCDFSCMISQESFSQAILPEIKAECSYLKGNSIYHLDGPGALRHLDALLEIDELAGIQWVYGAGQPTAAHWIPVLKKIQDAGKLVYVYIYPEDIDILLENLRPEGVFYSVGGDYSEEEAKAIFKKFEMHRRTFF